MSQSPIVDLAKLSQYGPRGLDGGGQPNSLQFRERWMANDARNNGKPAQTAEEAALSARLRHLGKQLGQQRPGQASENADAASSGRDPENGSSPSGNASAMARGLRLSSELVAGVLVGGVIGWSLDHWLGISPWGLIVFLLLGFVAGVLNVMRAAGVVAKQSDRL
jgi:ATP synthase protein I